jgi:hypothetical protein
MRNFFKKQSLPPVEDLLGALFSANQLLNPQWSKEEVVFNSVRRASELKSHKKLATYVNEICKEANKTILQIAELELQLQLHTDINN